MSQKEKPPLEVFILSIIIILLFLASIAIALWLLISQYPTHSDVFFIGVQYGAFLVVLLVCLSMIGLFLYRLGALLRRH